MDIIDTAVLKPKKFPNSDRMYPKLTLLFSDTHISFPHDIVLWTKVVARRKKCVSCGIILPPGSNSVRCSLRRIMGKRSFIEEKCLCKACALPKLKKMVEELEKPETIKPTKEEIKKEEW